jgi:site-specific DNA-methyltransferase (adenine-specific)
MKTNLIKLYHDRAENILPKLAMADAIVTDPPYAQTSLEWDRWVNGWPTIAASVSNQMWCFGSLRMFLERLDEFADWKLAQDVIWEKHNGSSAAADRFRRVHEHVVHFYRGSWSGLYKDPQVTHDATAKVVVRRHRPTQWGDMGDHRYVSNKGGPRLMGSVIHARSCHGHAVNETQKPEGVVLPLVAYSVPPGGLVVDCFAGSGTTLVVARRIGRRAIGIELRESQCRHIVERLAQQELLP